MTRRQSQLLQFILLYRTQNGGCCPSYDEMIAALGLRSKNSAHEILVCLRDRGYVSWIPGSSRSVTVLKGLDGQPVGSGVAA